MAEYLGAVASAVQLVDVALRASREAYGFLSAVKSAKEDVRVLREALRGVETNVRSLRHYATEFQKSKNAIEEFEILSETITGSFTGFHDDVVALKQILPPKPSQALAKKLKWVYNKGCVREVTKRLQERQLSLNTALAITGRLHNLRIRQDTTALLEESKVHRSNLEAQTDLVDLSLRTQQTTNDQMLKQLREANDGIVTTRNEARTTDARLVQHNKTLTDALSKASSTAVLHHTDMQATIHERTTMISNEIRDVNNQNTTLLQTLRSSEDTWTQHSSQTNAQLEGSQRSLDNITATIAEMRTTTIFSAANIQMMTDIMRRELQSTLEPVIEQAFTKSANRNKAMLDRLSDVIHRMTSEVGRGVYKMTSDEHGGDRSRGREDDRLEDFLDAKDLKIDSRDCHVRQNTHKPVASQFSYMTSKHRRSWTFKWRIGVLRISLCTTTRRISGSPECDIRNELNFCFTPSQVLMQLPGIEMLHRIGPDERGFHQLAPEICVFPVVANDHPIFNAISYGDLVQVQDLVSTGAGALRMQTEEGWTLLHYAATYSQIEICEFLTSHGLSWRQTNNCGYTPMHYGVYHSMTSRYGRSGQNAAEMFTLIERLGGGIEQLWYDFKKVNRHAELETSSRADKEQLTKAIDHILQHSGDGWFVLCHLIMCVLTPTTTNLLLLEAMLRNGLSPNKEILASFEGYEYTSFILSCAILEAAERMRSGRTEHVGCIISLLVHHGANIHYTYPDKFDRASSWYSLSSLWGSASGWDFETGWFNALQDAGVDVDEYCYENIRTRKQAIRLRGATRSSVDEQVLELPSVSGLRCRKCHKKFCRKHGRGILEYRELSEWDKRRREAV